MQPILSRYHRARARVQEKRSQWKTALYNAGDLVAFMARFFKEVVKPPYEWREIFYQAYLVGYKSTFLIGLTGFIMGAVLTIQTRPSMAAFGAISLIPGMVSVSVVREIGPVITAIICCGKVGSRMGAELGSMKVTEQIDAMEVSAINPYNYLVVTRILACTLMVPILVVFADAIGIVGGYVGINIHGDVNFYRYLTQIVQSLEFLDII